MMAGGIERRVGHGLDQRTADGIRLATIRTGHDPIGVLLPADNSSLRQIRCPSLHRSRSTN